MSASVTVLENIQSWRPDPEQEIARLQLENEFQETLYALQRHILPDEAQDMLTSHMPFGYVSALYPQQASDIQARLLGRVTGARSRPDAYVLLDWLTLRWRDSDINVRTLEFWLGSLSHARDELVEIETVSLQQVQQAIAIAPPPEDTWEAYEALMLMINTFTAVMVTKSYIVNTTDMVMLINLYQVWCDLLEFLAREDPLAFVTEEPA